MPDVIMKDLTPVCWLVRALYNGRLMGDPGVLNGVLNNERPDPDLFCVLSFLPSNNCNYCVNKTCISYCEVYVVVEYKSLRN
jgi:hypothetical protein